MARPTHIKPYLPPGRHGYYASYAGPNGKRCNAALSTDDLDEATRVCRDLMTLQAERLREGSPASLLICPRAYRLWFGSDIPTDLPDDEPDPDAEFESDISDRSELLLQIKLLEKENARLRPFEAKYNALAGDAEIQRLQAHKNAPRISDIRDKYWLDMEKLARGGMSDKTTMKRFFELLEPDSRVSDITTTQILDFIDAQTKKTKDLNRARRIRAHLSRFFSWIGVHYKIASPMQYLPTEKSAQQGDIHWHTLEEVEELLPTLSPKWAAIVAMMAFAGLSAHEVRGIRFNDLQEEEDGSWKIHITPHGKRTLKTGNRKRVLTVSDRLKPWIQAHYQDEKDGPNDEWLFPNFKGEIYHPGNFTDQLSAVLPAGMDARSLRRTFGSLLLRSGRTELQVAAAMGNTPAMVRRNYARLLGCEVNLNLL